MRGFILLIAAFLMTSCSKPMSNVTNIVLDDKKLNISFLKTIEDPEKALLSWYLYAYGNACDAKSETLKRQILKEMNIDDECNEQHLSNLLQWFSTDMMAVYKINKCPNLGVNSAIQNKFKNLILIRNADTLSIKYSIAGLNTIQEKSWNINRTDTYKIVDGTFIKIKPNE